MRPSPLLLRSAVEQKEPTGPAASAAPTLTEDQSLAIESLMFMKQQAPLVTPIEQLSSVINEDDRVAMVSSPPPAGPSIEELNEATTSRAKAALVSWYQRLNELYEFKLKYGHCDVPQKYAENRCLGIWVNKQRCEKVVYDDRIANKIPKDKDNEQLKTNLTPKKLYELEKIGFVWAKRKGDFIWNQHYNDLYEFYIHHGHSNLPCKYKPKPTLGRWITSQRSQYKRGTLPSDYIQKLEAIGFTWDMYAKLADQETAVETEKSPPAVWVPVNASHPRGNQQQNTQLNPNQSNCTDSRLQVFKSSTSDKLNNRTNIQTINNESESIDKNTPENVTSNILLSLSNPISATKENLINNDSKKKTYSSKRVRAPVASNHANTVYQNSQPAQTGNAPNDAISQSSYDGNAVFQNQKDSVNVTNSAKLSNLDLLVSIASNDMVSTAQMEKACRATRKKRQATRSTSSPPFATTSIQDTCTADQQVNSKKTKRNAAIACHGSKSSNSAATTREGIHAF